MLAAAIFSVVLISGCSTANNLKNVTTATPIRLETKKTIMLQQIKSNIKVGEIVGKLYGGWADLDVGPFRWGLAGDILHFSFSSLSAVLKDELENANYEIVANPVNLKGDEPQVATTLLLAGTVTELNMNLHYPAGISGNLPSRASAYLKIEWNVFSGTNKNSVYTVVTEGSVDQKSSKGHGVDSALGEAFSVAVKNLLADKHFTQVVLSETH